MPKVASALLERNQRALDQAKPLLESLSKQWGAIETALSNMGILKAAACTFESDEDPRTGHVSGEYQLSVQKLSGKWRVCTGYFHYQSPYGDVEDWTPVIDAPISRRIELLDYVDDLREAIVAANESCVAQLEEACEKSSNVLKQLAK